MSIDVKTISHFDTWVLVEAKRVLLDALDDEDRDTEREWIRSAMATIGRIAKERGATSDPPDGFDAALARFRDHKEARDAFESEAKSHAAAAAALEGRLVESFVNDGTQSIKRNGKTFFLQRERNVTALPGSQPALVDVMRYLGHDEMIVVQSQRFAAWCREMLNDEATGGHLPEEVLPLVKIHDAMRLRMRAS